MMPESSRPNPIHLIIFACLCLITLTCLPPTTQAQTTPFEQRSFEQVEGDGIREYVGTITEDTFILVYVKYLKRGDTVYAYAQSSSADTALVLLDVGFQITYAQDASSGGANNPALTHTLEAEGTYALALVSQAGQGDYRLVVGINTPSMNTADGTTQSFYDGLGDATPFTCADYAPAQRPILTGTPQRLERPLFVLHYTLEGADATLPAYAQELALALELSLTVQTGLLGWSMPPPDCAEGGDPRLDIYIQDLGYNTLGYATTDRFVGDNPNTSIREIRAAYGHLMIDNDMGDDLMLAQGNASPATLQLMRVTAAHEIHHLIQFGYDNDEAFFGFYEAGAVWLETLIYPDVTAATDHANIYLQTTNLCLGSMGEGVPLSRIYGEWLILDSLARDTSIAAYQRIWQSLAIADGLLAFYNTLQDIGIQPDELIRRTAIRNLLRDYALGDSLAPVRIQAEAYQPGDITPTQGGIQELGADYVRLNLPANIYHLEINPPSLRLTLIGLRDGIAYEHQLGAFGVIDTTPYASLYAIIHNPQQHTDSAACTTTPWRLRISDGLGSATVPAQSQTWDAGRYIRPPF